MADLSNMTPNDWTDLYKKFPHVQDFINERCLKNEYRYLTHEKDALERLQAELISRGYVKTWEQSEKYKRLLWVARRIGELQQWCPWLITESEDFSETEARAEYEAHSREHMS